MENGELELEGEGEQISVLGAGGGPRFVGPGFVGSWVVPCVMNTISDKVEDDR